MSIVLQTKVSLDHFRRGIRRRRKAFDVSIDAGMKAEGRSVARRWKDRVGVKTGALKRSIKWVLEGSGKRRTVRIFSDKHYASYEERGTKPHKIFPKSEGGVLRFTIGNRVIFSRSVSHPGTKGSGALKAAMRRSRGVPQIRKHLSSS